MVEAFSFENDEVISNVSQCMCTKIVRFLEAGSRPYSTTKSIRYEVVQISNGKAVRRRKKKKRSDLETILYSKSHIIKLSKCLFLMLLKKYLIKGF